MVCNVKKRLIIKGLVQGVYFRASTRDVARRNKITGWVRNTQGGCVEALLSGESEAVERVIEWCRQGPPGSSVTKVTIETIDKTDVIDEATEDFTDFTVRY